MNWTLVFRVYLNVYYFRFHSLSYSFLCTAKILHNEFLAFILLLNKLAEWFKKMCTKILEEAHVPINYMD